MCIQGEHADKLFILVSGEARVVVQFDKVAQRESPGLLGDHVV